VSRRPDGAARAAIVDAVVLRAASGRRRAWRVVGLTSLAALLVAGCLPAAATQEGRSIGDLYGVFVAIALVIAALVFGLTTYAILRYRAAGDASLPAQTKGNLKLEALWTGLPILTIIGLFIGTLIVLGRVEARAAQPGVELRVDAFRWGWSFTYPAAGVTVSGLSPGGPEAVVPVGEPIRVVLTATDVNHAFFVPLFLFKRDAIPGRTSQFDFTVDAPGTYGGQCAEFCGIYHARMPFSIRAVDRPAYEAWLAAQPRTPPAPGSAPPPSVGPAPSNPTPPSTEPSATGSFGGPQSAAPSLVQGG
jgi:cytochrome c oxidase subunit II